MSGESTLLPQARRQLGYGRLRTCEHRNKGNQGDEGADTNDRPQIVHRPRNPQQARGCELSFVVVPPLSAAQHHKGRKGRKKKGREEEGGEGGGRF